MTHTHFSMRAGDGANLQLMRWGQSTGKPVLHWAHATGFSAKTYTPMLHKLLPYFDVHSWDMRGHGESRDAGNPKTFKGWKTYYNDLITVLDQSPEPMWLAGHSIGATTSLAAAAQRPQKVKGLVLIEPVLLDPKQGWA